MSIKYISGSVQYFFKSLVKTVVCAHCVDDTGSGSNPLCQCADISLGEHMWGVTYC